MTMSTATKHELTDAYLKELSVQLGKFEIDSGYSVDENFKHICSLVNNTDYDRDLLREMIRISRKLRVSISISKDEKVEASSNNIFIYTSTPFNLEAFADALTKSGILNAYPTRKSALRNGEQQAIIIKL